MRVGVVCLIIALGACTEEATMTPHLNAATEAGRWLLSLEDLENGIPDRVGAGGSGTSGLGDGAAGRALFLGELFVATGDSAFLALASREMRRALASAALASQGVRHGLYRGSAGIGLVALELAAVLPGLEAAARDILREVAEEAVDRDGQAWDGVNDILVGAAGIGVALLRASEQLDDSVFLGAAVHTGDLLLEVGRSEGERGIRWFRGADAPIDLPNFSHGTAGVGFFLTQLAHRTGEARFVEAAGLAARYLESVRAGGEDLFLVPYGVPNEGYAAPYDIGWAHGPAGTGLFFYELWKTGVSGDLFGVDGAAAALMASGLPGTSQDTSVWRSPFRWDRRFGTAGSAMFLFDWGQETGNSEYLDRAFDIVEDLRRRSTHRDGFRWWTVPLYGFQGEGEAEFTGIFYGASGFGLTLLRAHYASLGMSPNFRLPDDPFERRSEADTG